MLPDLVKLKEDFNWAVGTLMETSLRRFKMTYILNLLLCTTSQFISECDKITEFWRCYDVFICFLLYFLYFVERASFNDSR